MSKITKSARDRDCTVRISGVCRFDTETTVFAHLNGGGIGRKHNDIHGAYACGPCHEWLDSGYIKTHTRAERDLEHYRAMVETQLILLEEGLIKT